MRRTICAVLLLAGFLALFSSCASGEALRARVDGAESEAAALETEIEGLKTGLSAAEAENVRLRGIQAQDADWTEFMARGSGSGWDYNAKKYAEVLNSLMFYSFSVARYAAEYAEGRGAMSADEARARISDILTSNDRLVENVTFAEAGGVVYARVWPVKNENTDGSLEYRTIRAMRIVEEITSYVKDMSYAMRALGSDRLTFLIEDLVEFRIYAGYDEARAQWSGSTGVMLNPECGPYVFSRLVDTRHNIYFP